MNDLATPYEPTSDEKTMATLAQVLQLVGSWIAPLIIFLIRRKSRFVAFHAVQALLWQCTFLVLWFGSMALLLITTIPPMTKAAPNSPPPAGFFLGFFGFWLAMMGFTALNLVIGIYFGIKAGRGEWAAYPLLGKLAHRIVGA